MSPRNPGSINRPKPREYLEQQLIDNYARDGKRVKIVVENAAPEIPAPEVPAPADAAPEIPAPADALVIEDAAEDAAADAPACSCGLCGSILAGEVSPCPICGEDLDWS